MSSDLIQTDPASGKPTEGLKSFDAEGVQFAWDSTSLTNYMTCPRFYYYTNIEGWRTKGSSVHLWFGGLYATALEHFYKHRAEGASSEEALRLVVAEALESTWHRVEINGELRGGPVVYDDPNKNRESLIRTIIWYVDHFQNDPAEVIHLANGKPAVELSFSFEVDDDIMFCGHLDRMVTYSGEPYVMDQKTSQSQVSSYYMKQFDLSAQMSMYSLAASTVFSVPVKGVIIDAAQIAANYSNFERGFTFRTEAQLSEWYDETMQVIHAARQATAAHRFPRNTTACGKYGGCEFRSVCSADPRIRSKMLKSDFDQRPRWDPLERR